MKDRPLIDRRRICFLTLTQGQGGAERQLYYLLKMLVEDGYSPTLLSLTQGEFWEEPIRALGVPVVWVGKNPSRLIRLLAIGREVGRIKPGVFQSQHFSTNLYASIVSWFYRIPCIGAIRNDAFSEIKAVGKILGYMCLNFPTVLAGNSRSGLANAISLGRKPEKVFFLPNVVDCSTFIPTKKYHREKIELVSIGRVVHQKRYDRLIRIVDIVKQKSGQKITVKVIGAGREISDLKKKAADYGLLPPEFEFLTPMTDVRPVLAGADIFVLTSDHEGTPNVVLEAMASGVPVVATRVGDVPFLVENGCSGFVCSPEDEEGLANAILELIQNEELREKMGAAGRKFVEENHSFSSVRDTLQRLYHSVTG